MKFIKYLILGVIELFGVMNGVPSEDSLMLPVGLAVLATICAIFILLLILLKKTKLKKVLVVVLSFVFTFLILAVFCGICILIEYITGAPIMK